MISTTAFLPLLQIFRFQYKDEDHILNSGVWRLFHTRIDYKMSKTQESHIYNWDKSYHLWNYKLLSFVDGEQWTLTLIFCNSAISGYIITAYNSPQIRYPDNKSLLFVLCHGIFKANAYFAFFIEPNWFIIRS